MYPHVLYTPGIKCTKMSPLYLDYHYEGLIIPNTSIEVHCQVSSLYRLLGKPGTQTPI